MARNGTVFFSCMKSTATISRTISRPTEGIKHKIKKGQELLVQVVKDPVMKKGAMLTTFISLPGRHVVLMPGSENRGISRKIEEEEERQRIKEIVAALKVPDEFGLIVRTAGKACTKSTITKDLKDLMKLWKTIQKKAVKGDAPALLYKERNLSVRSIRDYFTADVSEILIDDETVYQEVKDFVNIISPKHLKIVKLYTGDQPIFAKYRLEEQIASIFENRVKLKSGGSIVIGQTEALVAIDVNSGKSTNQKSIEQTALKTNLEAAEEIARQLRMRDLGGLIVLDFIDMRESKHKAEVEKAMKTHLTQDKARTKVGKLSQFGLMEMSPPADPPVHRVRKPRPLRPLRRERGDPLRRNPGAPVPAATSDGNHQMPGGRRGRHPSRGRGRLSPQQQAERDSSKWKPDGESAIRIEGDSAMTPGQSNITCRSGEKSGEKNTPKPA